MRQTINTTPKMAAIITMEPSSNEPKGPSPDWSVVDRGMAVVVVEVLSRSLGKISRGGSDSMCWFVLRRLPKPGVGEVKLMVSIRVMYLWVKVKS